MHTNKHSEDRIADLHSNTRALKCLVDAMQDNSGKITSDLKSELKRLGRVVENLSRNYERLERQVEELRNASTVPDSARTPSPKTPARTPSPKTPSEFLMLPVYIVLNTLVLLLL